MILGAHQHLVLLQHAVALPAVAAAILRLPPEVGVRILPVAAADEVNVNLVVRLDEALQALRRLELDEVVLVDFGRRRYLRPLVLVYQAVAAAYLADAARLVLLFGRFRLRSPIVDVDEVAVVVAFELVDYATYNVYVFGRFFRLLRVHRGGFYEHFRRTRSVLNTILADTLCTLRFFFLLYVCYLPKRKLFYSV